MQLKQLNKAFLIMTGVSVTVFLYLVFLGYDDIKSVRDVLKIVAAILFPVPVIFFIRFIWIERFLPQNSEEAKLKNQKPAILLLVITVIIVLIILQLLEWMHLSLEKNLIFAHLMNSTAISGYVLNYILYNNLKTNGILSGLLMALAIHVFFFIN